MTTQDHQPVDPANLHDIESLPPAAPAAFVRFLDRLQRVGSGEARTNLRDVESLPAQWAPGPGCPMGPR